MTLPQNVKDALALIETLANDEGDYAEPRAVETIRAHLMSQEAEVKRLNAWIAEYCKANRKAFLADQSRLAAANALLLYVSRYLDPRHYDRAIKKIQSHLQGDGDE